MPDETGLRSFGRRDVLKGSGVAMLAGLAGCTGGSGGGGSTESSDDGSAGSGGGESTATSTATSTSTGPLDLSVSYEAGFGIEEANAYHARDVGLNQFDIDATITVTDGSDISLQSQVAGEAELSRAGLMNAAPIIEQGKSFKSLFGINSGSDYLLVVDSTQIETWEDLLSADGNGPKIGMNNPRNTDVLQIVGTLLDKGILSPDDDYTDLMNLVQIGYSSARTAAVQTGDIAAGALHHGQWLRIKDDNPNLTSLGYFIDTLPAWGTIKFMATPDNIERHREKYVRWAKALVQASRELSEGNEDLYVDVIQKFAPGGGPEESNLRETYSFIEEKGLYPVNGGLDEEAMDFMLDLAATSGVTESRVPTEDVFDRSILDEALDDLGRV